MNQVNKVREQIDWSIVVSTIVAAIILGLMLYGMRQVGLGKAATVISKGA